MNPVMKMPVMFYTSLCLAYLNLQICYGLSRVYEKLAMYLSCKTLILGTYKTTAEKHYRCMQTVTEMYVTACG